MEYRSAAAERASPSVKNSDKTGGRRSSQCHLCFFLTAPPHVATHLGSLIARTCALVPNFKVMEIDIDDVKWKDDIVTVPPVIENGDLVLPSGPGWGADVNEEFVLVHPPKR